LLCCAVASERAIGSPTLWALVSKHPRRLNIPTTFASRRRTSNNVLQDFETQMGFGASHENLIVVRLVLGTYNRVSEINTIKTHLWTPSFCSAAFATARCQIGQWVSKEAISIVTGFELDTSKQETFFFFVEPEIGCLQAAYGIKLGLDIGIGDSSRQPSTQ